MPKASTGKSNQSNVNPVTFADSVAPNLSSEPIPVLEGELPKWYVVHRNISVSVSNTFINKGQIISYKALRDTGLEDFTIGAFTARGHLKEFYDAPLSAVRGFQSVAEKVQALGITTVIEFLTGDVQAISEVLGFPDTEVEARQTALRADWLSYGCETC